MTPETTVKVSAPEGVTSASVEGAQYHINEHGHFVMLLKHAVALAEHGFKVIAEEVKELVEDALGEKQSNEGEPAPAQNAPATSEGETSSSESSKPVTMESAPTDANESLIGSSVQPAHFTLEGGDQMQLGDVVAEAHKRTGASVAEWNALPDADRESIIQSVVDELPLAKAPEAAAIDHLENEGGKPAPEAPEVNEGGDGSSKPEDAA